jgi:hypothetical protein
MMVTVVETTVGSACGEYVSGLEDSAIDKGAKHQGCAGSRESRYAFA